MASNIRMGQINQPVITVDLSVTLPATNTTTVIPKSGTPVIACALPGVAEADVDTVTGLTPVNVSCVAALAVKGKKSGGNAAISVGDRVYIQTDGTLDGDSGGVSFGLAFGNDESASVVGTDTRSGQVVASGATTTIRVWVGK